MRCNSREYILGLRTKQLQVFNCPARFRVLVAGRRFGKTELALTEMLCCAHANKKSVVWYVGPSYRQAKRIAWSRLKKISRPYWAKAASETDLSIELRNGSMVAIRGSDRPDSLRGDGLDLVVLDEFASMRPESWTEVLRPALSDRKGRALFIGTPKGRNHFYDHFEYAKTDPDWAAFQFTTAQGGIVDPAELHTAAHQLDPECYRQEFEAEFTGIGRNRVYYAFDRTLHLKPLHFEKLYPLVWTIDFNVNPMCMLIIQRIGDIVHVLDEIVLHDTNTEQACVSFLDRLSRLHSLVPAHQRPLNIEMYGDASGNQRRTSGVATDWTIIRNFFSHWKGQITHSVHANTVNPAVRDRVNCVNSRLQNATGEVRLFIDPKCRELIRDLEQVIWALDATGLTTSEINKSDPKRTHSSDALGYYIAQVFPLRPLAGHQSSGRII